jgi:hypothetical protein
MSRQGSYVGSRGGNVNWASGLSGALSDLSKSLLAQNENELERERLLAKEAEDKRRYELGRQEAADERAYQRERQRAADERNTTTFNQQQEAYRQEQAKKAALRDVAKFTTDYNYDTKYTLKDYAPEQQEVFTRLFGAIDTEEKATKNFLLGKGNIEDALNAYEARLKTNSSLSDAAKKDLLAARKNRLLSFDDQAVGLGYDDETRVNTAAALTDELYNAERSRVNEAIESGRGILRKEQLSKYISMLPESVRENLSRAEIEASLGDLIDKTSRRELQATESARVAAANETKDKQIKSLERFYSLVQDKTKGTKFKSRKASDVIDALKNVEGLDIGPIDNARGRTFLEYLLTNPDKDKALENLDPDAAVAAILMAKDTNMFGTSLPSVGSKEGVDLVNLAKQFNARGTSYSGSGTKPTKEEFLYTPEQARDLTNLMRSRLTFAVGDPSTLGIDSRYDRNLIKPAQPVQNTGTPAPDSVPLNARTRVGSTESGNSPELDRLTRILGNDPIRSARNTKEYLQAVRNVDDYLETEEDIARYQRRLNEERKLPTYLQTPSIQRRAEQEIEDLNARLERLRRVLAPAQQ